MGGRWGPGGGCGGRRRLPATPGLADAVHRAPAVAVNRLSRRVADGDGLLMEQPGARRPHVVQSEWVCGWVPVLRSTVRCRGGDRCEPDGQIAGGRWRRRRDAWPAGCRRVGLPRVHRCGRRNGCYAVEGGGESGVQRRDGAGNSRVVVAPANATPRAGAFRQRCGNRQSADATVVEELGVVAAGEFFQAGMPPFPPA